MVRGMEGIKEAEVDLAGTKVKVAVAHTLSNARKLLDQIKEGKSPYHFIEIMTCPADVSAAAASPSHDVGDQKKRAESIYKEDINLGIRKSHENPDIQALYKEWLEKPLGEKSHHLLHTDYTKRGIV
jgi:iron only hydrogenase large subunit-like protein